MLIQFKTKNYKSIRNELTFNTVAKDIDEPSNELVRHYVPIAPASKALNTATFIYGSNASGKSNLINAMGMMKSLVINSTRTTEGDKLPFEPYAFSELTKHGETEFEMELISNDIRYQYGFTYNAERILEEWLYAYPKGKAQKWLMRYYDKNSKSYIYDRCDSLNGSKKLWESVTRDNALFLSTAVQLKSEQLKPIFNWFKNTLRVVGSSGPSNGFSIDKMTEENPKSKSAIIRFMRAADFSIKNFSVNELDLDQEISLMPKELKDLILSSNKEHKVLEIKSGHTNDNGELEYLDLKDESDGTQKIFELAGPWLDTFEHSRVLVMDEMNLHLHPNLTSFLIKLFYDKNLNNTGSQLITTTHEVGLLKEHMSKRDQIWVMDRYRDGSSAINNLTKFSPRLDLNLEKAFLDGRFEGVPVTNVAEVIRARGEYNG